MLRRPTPFLILIWESPTLHARTTLFSHQVFPDPRWKYVFLNLCSHSCLHLRLFRLFCVQGAGTYVSVSHQLQTLREQRLCSNHYSTTALNAKPGLEPNFVGGMVTFPGHGVFAPSFHKAPQALWWESEDRWFPLAHGLQRFLKEGGGTIVRADFPILLITGP